MGIVKREDVAASWVGEQLVCAECLKNDDDEATFVTQAEIDNSDDIYICDRCDKRIE